MEKIVGVAQLYFMPHPLLEIVQRLMAHPVDGIMCYLSIIAAEPEAPEFHWFCQPG